MRRDLAYLAATLIVLLACKGGSSGSGGSGTTGRAPQTRTKGPLTCTFTRATLMKFSLDCKASGDVAVTEVLGYLSKGRTAKRGSGKTTNAETFHAQVSQLGPGQTFTAQGEFKRARSGNAQGYDMTVVVKLAIGSGVDVQHQQLAFSSKKFGSR